MYADPQLMVEVFFVGGPWNNRLVPVPEDWARRACILVPVPVEVPVRAWTGDPELIRHNDVAAKAVTYRRDRPLPTGVPVFTCLAKEAKSRDAS